MRIAILTSKNQWFEHYVQTLSESLDNAKIFNNHEDFKDKYDIVFILSYHQLVGKEFLSKNTHNIVIHESLLPKGKGWSPFFWQVLDNKRTIPFTMFEASNGIDDGDIYLVDELELTGFELNDELRKKQAEKIINMCINFVNNYDKLKSLNKQSGDETFYAKRGLNDSRLDVNKSIKEQFNLLRVVSNKEYPAFFEIDGHKFLLKIEKFEDAS
jgi:methionyl-tRNA formyltransferase